MSMSTLPQLFFSKVESAPTRVPFRQKHFGYYKEWTWQDCAAEVRAIYAALCAAGFRRGDRALIIGEPSVQQFAFEMAVAAAGGISVELFLSTPVEGIAESIKATGPAIILIDRGDQLAKLLALKQQMPVEGMIVVLDERAQFFQGEEVAIGYRAFKDLPPIAGAASPVELSSAVAVGSATDPVMVFPSDSASGSTQLVVHSHQTLLSALTSLAASVPALSGQGLRGVATLPTAHFMGKLNIYLPLVSGLVVHFSEDLSDFRRFLFEISPEFLLLPPQILEKLASELSEDVRRARGLKGLACRLAAGVVRYAEARPGRAGSSVLTLARLFVLQPLLDKAGLARLVYVAATGTQANPQLRQRWRSLGLQLHELYARPECGPVPLPLRLDDRSGSFANVDVRRSEQGELHIRSDSRAIGWWSDAGFQTVGSGDWYHTGDLVEPDDGDLRIVGQMDSFVNLTSGFRINEQAVAAELRKSIYIAEAVVLGDGGNAVRALIELNFDELAHWMRERNLTYTTNESLSRHPAVEGLIRAEIDTANRALPPEGLVADFRILPSPLDPEMGVVTPTRVIVREKLKNVFGNLIEEMS